MKRIIVVVQTGMITEVFADTDDIDLTIIDEDVEYMTEEQAEEIETLKQIY